MSQLDEEKLFYERFWSLHRDPILVSVCKEFGIGVFRRSCVLEGLDAFLLETGFSGRRVVEIGTCNGLTSLVLSRYFDEVVSVDVVPNELKRKITDHVGVQNVSFFDVKDNTAKAALIRDLEFDAAFSDGDHARDTETDFALVEPCGKVLFHEVWAAQPSVVKLVSRLRASGGLVIDKGKFAVWTR